MLPSGLTCFSGGSDAPKVLAEPFHKSTVAFSSRVCSPGFVSPGIFEPSFALACFRPCLFVVQVLFRPGLFRPGFVALFSFVCFILFVALFVHCSFV